MVAVKAHQATAFLKTLDIRIGAVLFYGPDAGMVSERAAYTARRMAEREQPAGEIVRIDDETLADDPDRLVVEVGTLPMFGGRKVVRAIAGRRIDGRALGALINGPPLAAWLVVESGNLLPSAELRTVFEKHASAAAVACYADEARDVGALIDEVLRGQRMTIEPAARDALLPRLGADRALSRNEIEKLALYATGRDPITLDDVEAIVGDASEIALDQIVAAAANGRVSDALLASTRATSAGENAQALIAALQRAFVRLHRARAALDAGQPMEVVLRLQRPPLNFKQQPIFSAQCRAWSLPALTAALDRIAAAALAARTSSAIEDLLAERLLIDLCALASPPGRSAARR